VIGGYKDMRQALSDRGWVENPDHFSPFFDFKWCSKVRDIDYPNLSETQIVNHFEKNSIITTKAGLAKQLRNIKWYHCVDGQNFYPTCHCLNDENGPEDFLNDFRSGKATSILKSHLIKISENKEKYFESINLVDFLRLVMGYLCTKKKLIDYDDIIDMPETINSSITDTEWKILDAGKRTHEDVVLGQWGMVPIQAYTILFPQDEIDEIINQVFRFRVEGLDLEFMERFEGNINRLNKEC
jgi:hypothetical protein